MRSHSLFVVFTNRNLVNIFNITTYAMNPRVESVFDLQMLDCHSPRCPTSCNVRIFITPRTKACRTFVPTLNTLFLFFHSRPFYISPFAVIFHIETKEFLNNGSRGGMSVKLKRQQRRPRPMSVILILSVRQTRRRRRPHCGVFLSLQLQRCRSTSLVSRMLV